MHSNQLPDYKSNSEEIDLIALMMQLWHSKLTILAFTGIALILSGIYLSVAKEKWRSDAIVTMPDASQTANYVNAMNILYAQTPSNAPSVTEVQQRFFTRFNSLLTAFSEKLSNKKVREKLVIEPVVKGQEMPIKIIYTGNTAMNAQSTLEKYINYINREAVQELNNDLTVSINSHISDLRQSLEVQIKIAREKQQQRLDIFNQALRVAAQSGIKKAIVNQAETQSEDTLYLLGSDALSAMVKNESSRPLPLSDYYYDTRQALAATTGIKVKPETLHSFHYIMRPSLPVHKESPGRALVLVLAVLSGIIFGSGFVLGRNAFQRYRLHASA